MKKYLLIIVGVLSTQGSSSQIDPSKIDILRDAYGVPHIFAKTDAEVAYGLAWAHSEDDFHTIQIGYLAGNALLSRHLGKDGASADFVSQLIRSASYVDAHYEKDISEDYKQLLEGYCQGINSYAKHHPEEVLQKSLFPITPKKLLNYTHLQLFIASDAGSLVSAIVGNKTPDQQPKEEITGSNTFAFNSTMTTDGNTYLATNPHQPLDGPTSWYEAHLNSEEGTNIVGALFSGAPSILIGANEHLAWSHTVNHPDKADIFKLEMHPKDKTKYKVDDLYLTLKKYKAKVFIKLLGIKIGINKKYYNSIYGPTLKNKSGYYAVRTPSLFNIKATEQWWRMNKAKSFSEFYSALEMKAIPGYNIGYADKNDTIFYISNGLIPKRAEGYDWTQVVPGNTMKTLWTSYYDIDELPQVIQPKSGFIYNTNNSPFKSSAIADNPDPKNYHENMGFETYDNNRSLRFQELVYPLKEIDYATFREIKYDHQLPKTLGYHYMDINTVFKLNPENYPEIAVLINSIQEWDKKATASSKGAASFAVFYHHLKNYYKDLGPDHIYDEATLVQVLKDTKNYMLTHFKTTDITLGDFQKVVRGNKVYPSFGLPDVLTAMHGTAYKDGKMKITAGESYIQLTKFTKKGVEIESIISYGSSDHPESQHYNDQLDLYMQFKTKKMHLNKEKWYQECKVQYHPL